MIKKIAKKFLALMFAGCLFLNPVIVTQTTIHNSNIVSPLDDNVIQCITKH